MNADHYRADVDGLRAVAVGLVCLFHAGVACPGGFVGVDVFFVISGYLITNLIRRQHAESVFHLGEFYARRIRRIVPACTASILLTLAAGWFTSWPEDYLELATSAGAQQALSANIFFWKTTGYFDGPAELKPLLHTWSLSLEEQFYLLYPFALAVLLRGTRRRMVLVLCLLAVLSWVAGAVLGPYRPAATFFLLPTRAWELLLGALLCFVPATRRRSTAESLATTGLLLIVLSAFLLDARSSFPIPWALPPCMGAALLLHAGAGQRTLVGRVLSSPPFVGIGLISYSLYLLHWPLMALTRQWTAGPLPPDAAAWALAASVALAYLSWRFVETPLRRPSTPNPTRGALRLLACSTALVAVAIAGVLLTRGAPGRIPSAALEQLAARSSVQGNHESTVFEARAASFPRLGDAHGPPTCLLWGDSHAMAYTPGVEAACLERGVTCWQATHSCTPPLLDFVYVAPPFGLGPQAPAYSEAVVAAARQHGVRLAFLAAVWTNYAADPEFEPALRATCAALRAGGVRVVIVLQVPRYEVHVPLALARATWLGTVHPGLTVEAADHERATHDAVRKIRRAAADLATVVDPASLFLGEDGRYHPLLEGVVLYRDPHHLTIEGGRRLTPLFLAALDEAQR